MSTAYNKLVRDRVPEIIRSNGQSPRVRVLADDRELLTAALEKVVEEARELVSAPSRTARIAELADLREVIDLVMRLSHIRGCEVSRERAKRKRTRGAFGARFFLERVD